MQDTKSGVEVVTLATTCFLFKEDDGGYEPEGHSSPTAAAPVNTNTDSLS